MSPYQEPVPHQGAILPVQSPPGGAVLQQQQDLAGGKTQQRFEWYPDIQPNNRSHLGESENENIDFNVIRHLVDKVTPGFGMPHASCGDVRFKIVCPDDPAHYTKPMAHRCHRPECPICYPSWAARAADRAVDTIEGYRSATGTPYLSRHITLSPDPDVFPFLDATQDSLRYLLVEGRRVCGILGITAASVIAHPYRIKDQYKGIVQDLADAAGLNRYEWALQQSNWSDLVYFSPHLHIQAYGPLMDAAQFEEQTGWIYKNHDGDGDSGRAGPSLKRTVYYLLTHAWVRGNNATVRYWLGMSTRRLECRQLHSIKEPILCPVCQTHAVKTPADVVDLTGKTCPFYQDLHNAEHAYRKIVVKIYFVRQRRPRTRTRISQAALLVWGPAGPPGRVDA